MIPQLEAGTTVKTTAGTVEAGRPAMGLPGFSGHQGSAGSTPAIRL